MAGKIIADQIEHSTAGSLDTQYVVNGSAKVWVNFLGAGTVAIRDSYNAASLTDNGTGNYTITSSSSMGNTTYSCQSTAGRNAGDLLNASNNEGSYPRTTSSLRTEICRSNSDTQYDAGTVEMAWIGDLA
jgi:hypothetical protein